MPLFALEQDEAIKVCEQLKSVPDFRIFYDENATSEQIDARLDQILDFLRQNPHRVNDELGEYCDRFLRLLSLIPRCIIPAKPTLSG